MLFPVDSGSNLLLRYYYRKFRSAELVVKIVNISYVRFFVVLISVGIIICSCTGSMTIIWYGKIDTMIYILMPVATITGFTLSLLLTYLANIPYKNTELFLKFWRLHLKSKKDKQIIRACKPLGITGGPYGMGRAQLGFLICNDMIKNMITFLLLDSF